MIRHSTLHLSFLSFFYLVSAVLSFTAHFLFLTSNAIIILPVFGVIHRERIGSAWVSAPALYSPPSIRRVRVTGKWVLFINWKKKKKKKSYKKLWDTFSRAAQEKKKKKKKGPWIVHHSPALYSVHLLTCLEQLSFFFKKNWSSSLGVFLWSPPGKDTHGSLCSPSQCMSTEKTLVPHLSSAVHFLLSHWSITGPLHYFYQPPYVKV